MRYLGMPAGMWALFERSFRDRLTDVLGYGRTAAAGISKKAHGKYRELIGKLPDFEKGDRFQMNIVSCAMLAAHVLSMPSRPGVDELTAYYSAAMMTGPMKWFCRKSGKAKFSPKDMEGMKRTAAFRAADRNPYSWNMEYLPYADGSGYITVDEFAAYAKGADGAKKGQAAPGPKKMPAADGKRGERDGARHHGPDGKGQPGRQADGATGATELRGDGRGPHGPGHDGRGFGPDGRRGPDGCPDIDFFGKFHHDTGMDYRLLADFGRIDKDHDYRISEPEYTVWSDQVKQELTDRLERVKAADFRQVDLNRVSSAPAWQPKAPDANPTDKASGKKGKKRADGKMGRQPHLPRGKSGAPAAPQSR